MKTNDKNCGCEDKKKDEISSTSAVPPVTVPIGATPNYGGKEKKKKDVEVWDDQEVVEIKENILKSLKKLK